MRAAADRDGLSQESLGIRRATGDVVHQPRMMEEERPIGIALGERRQRGVGRRPGSRTDVQPRLGKRQQERIDTLSRNPLDALQPTLVVAVTGVLQSENEAGQPRAIVDVDETLGECDRVFDPAVGDQQGHRSAQESGIAWIALQSAPEVLRRHRIVAARVGMAPDEIAADHRVVVAFRVGCRLGRHGRSLLIGCREIADAGCADQAGDHGTAQPGNRPPPTRGSPLPCATYWHSWGRPRLPAPPIRCSAWGP